MRAALQVRDDHRGSGLFWFTTQEQVKLGKPGRVMERMWQKACVTREALTGTEDPDYAHAKELVDQGFFSLLD